MQLSCYNCKMGRTPTAKQNITSLLERNHMLSAVDIQDQLNEAKLQLNKTTIYRTLDKMLEDGEICRHTLGRDVLLYELRSHHHDHLVCEKCGKVTAIECTLPVPKEMHGFTVSHHHVTLFGICRVCSKS